MDSGREMQYSVGMSLGKRIADIDKGLGALGGTPEERARRAAVHGVFPFIVQQVYRKYKGVDEVHKEDYLQAALMGAFEAYDHYDPGHGTPFLPFAKKYIQRAFNRCSRKMIMVPMSVHDMEHYYALKPLVEEREKQTGRKVVDDELMVLVSSHPAAGVQGLTLRQAKLLLQYSTGLKFIDGEEQDALADPAATEPELLWPLPSVKEKMVVCQKEQVAKVTPTLRDRMCGCLTGLFCGDALGAPFEFKSREEVRELYPDGIGDFEEGWHVTNNRHRGCISDDAEMSVALLHSLYTYGGFSRLGALRYYQKWGETSPENMGQTVSDAIFEDRRNPASQGNRALARVAPIALFAVCHPGWDWVQAAKEDAKLTHVHPKCAAANIIYVESLILAMQGKEPQAIYEQALKRVKALKQNQLTAILEQAAHTEPDYANRPGWVHNAFQAAYYWLLYYKKFRSALISIVNSLGAPNANASIAGALLGAHLGEKKIPKAWRETIRNASPRSPMFSPSMAFKILKVLPEA